MSKEQTTLYKVLLSKLGELTRCVTFDDYLNSYNKESRLAISDATYETLLEVLDTYQALDYDNHKLNVNRGIFEAAVCIGDNDD